MLSSQLAFYVARFRNNPDYFSAVATSYALIATQVAVQIFLVPLYVAHLGKLGFGSLTILMAIVSTAFLGISWANGGVVRVLGEAAAKGNDEDFAQGYWATKYIFTGYGALVACGLVCIGLLWPGLFFGEVSAEDRAAMVWAVVAAACHLVLMADVAVDWMALATKRRQAIANGLLVLSLGAFALLVIPWLLAGGGIAGVFVCLIIGNLLARLVAWGYWRRRNLALQMRWPSQVTLATARLSHLFKSGYFVYGMLFMVLQADTLIVGLLKGPHVAAEFVLVWKIAELLTLMLWRLSESFQPEYVHTDMRGDKERLLRIYRHGVALVRIASVVTGVAYALLGHWIVALWIGKESTPDIPWAYFLAGGAIAWLGSARFPAFFAYSLIQLRPLIAIAAIELAAKLVIILVLIWRVDYLAPLIAINVVHLCGVAFLYARLPWRRDGILSIGAAKE